MGLHGSAAVAEARISAALSRKEKGRRERQVGKRPAFLSLSRRRSCFGWQSISPCTAQGVAKSYGRPGYPAVMGEYFGTRDDRYSDDDPPVRVRCDRRGWTSEDLDEIVQALGGKTRVLNEGPCLIQQSTGPPLWFQIDLATAELFWGMVKGVGFYAGVQISRTFRAWLSKKLKEVSERVVLTPHKIHISGVYQDIEVQIQLGGSEDSVLEALEALPEAALLVERVVEDTGSNNLQGLAVIYRGEDGWVVNFHYDADGKIHSGPPRQAVA